MRAPKAAGTGRNDRNMARKVAAAPEFSDIRLTYGQGLIRFSGQKTNFGFPAVSVSIFGIQGDRILLILMDQVRAGGFRLLFDLLFLTLLATI